MASLIFGLVLFFFPFILINFFSDKKKGFIFVLFCLFLFQTILALLTQTLGMFYYAIILGFTLLADVIVLATYFIIKTKTKKILSFDIKTIDWVVLAVIVLSFLCLWQVHYNYMGQMSMALDQGSSFHKVENAKLPYPYYSDEWYAAGLIKDSINSHKLPIYDFLTKSRPFYINGELLFHSFLAEIFVLLGLNPVLNYSAVSLFFNILIIVLIYIFLRINNVKKLSSLLASLSVLYISNGANLPGIWYFIPANMSILVSIIGLCFMSLNKPKMAMFTGIFVFLFYPPLIIFYLPTLIIFLIKDKEDLKKSIKYFIVFFVFTILFFSLSRFFPAIRDVVVAKIFYISSYGQGMPQYMLFDVVPFYVIILAIVGMLLGLHKKYSQGYKQKMLLAPVVIGGLLWFFYNLTTYRFGIEYQRVVFYTSLILVIFSGFGLSFIENYFGDKKKWIGYFKCCQIFVLVLFVIFIPFYTVINNWKNFIILYPNGEALFPAAPADEYLTNEDLRIIKDIKNKTFLSLPWKGTTISVATGNYPALAKEGNMTAGLNSTLDDFLKADCVGKLNVAKELNLDYIYLQGFDCPNFLEVSKSQEGFVLYKVN